MCWRNSDTKRETELNAANAAKLAQLCRRSDRRTQGSGSDVQIFEK